MDGRAGDGNVFNICLSDRHEPTEGRSFASETERQTVPRQMLQQAVLIFICVMFMDVCMSRHVRAARKLSVSGGVLLDRLKLILAISGAGVNTG